MNIETRLEGETMHVTLEGRMDAAWSGTVGKTFQETLLVGCHHIVMDLSKVNYLSSAGIRILMLLAKQLKSIGGGLRISDQSAAVREVLEMVGFHRLLESAMPTSPREIATAAPRQQSWQWGEHAFEVYELDAAATQRGRLIGQPPPWQVEDQTSGRAPTVLRMLPGTLALGLGAIGGHADLERAGELLAVNGLAIALPGDDPAHPDWLTREGDLVPDISLTYGLFTEGAFRHLLRFGVAPDAPPMALSTLAGAVLERGGCAQAVLVAVAETASLIGVALQTPPDRLTGDWFAFPAVRDRMLFTAEPAHASETCLIVGLVARDPPPRLAALLRPLGKGSALHGHCHAAIVPYRPVHKGLIELEPTLETLLESQTLRGVLHLLNDDREGMGAGESHLRRGAVWCAPVHFDELAVDSPEAMP